MRNLLPSICFVSTIAWPLRVYMGPHIRTIAKCSQVTLVSEGVSLLSGDSFGADISFFAINIQRKIRPVSDLVGLFRLWVFFRKRRFDCVHSIMPKAGLLAMLASAAAGVPVRFHTFTGQVWATKTGLSRRFFMGIDCLIASLATDILTDSLSQRDFLVTNGIVKAGKISVLCNGSIVGVDTRRFVPDSWVRKNCRYSFGIGEDDFVFLFVGRLNREKGVFDLLKAFQEIAVVHPRVHLLLVGPDESGCGSHIVSLPREFGRRIHQVGFTTCPEQFMAMSDVLCLPSYREGFGSVLIEAAAVGLPSIASRIYGITDAVVDGVTGILHEPGNVSEMVSCMLRLEQDEALCRQMASAARARVTECFSEEILTGAFVDFYRKHGVLA